MKTTFSIIATVIISAYIIIGCKKKDEENLPPAINFKVGTTYTKNNDTVAVGNRLYFGIQARGTSDNITNFTIKKILENGTVITVMDTGMNALSIDIDKLLYQNVENKVTWVFTVMDRNRMTAQISMDVYKDPNSVYGGIYYFPSVRIGYQNSTLYGHFMNPSTGIVYFEDSATTNQNKIDVLCYYNTADGPVLSSSGEMDNFSTTAQTLYPIITNWTTRNYTKWDISIDNGTNTPLTTLVFDAAQNDSLLIVSYHEIWGKKKFKFATTGKIIPFVTSAGKKGLMKVNNAEAVDSGFIDVDIKIQQ